MQRNILPVVLFYALTALPTFAVSIVVDPNPVVIANSITDNLTGADLAGLVVTATYETPGNPTTVSAVWAATGPTSGAASVIGPFFTPILTISVTGSASGALAWQYGSTFLSRLSSLQFNGTAAGVYFDRAHSGTGTPGSGPGADISFGPLIPSGVDSSIAVTYSSAVSLDGNPPQDDLYAKMTISFADLEMGGLIPQDFAFTQPTDSNITPEPTSLISVLAGLAGLYATKERVSAKSRR